MRMTIRRMVMRDVTDVVPVPRIEGVQLSSAGPRPRRESLVSCQCTGHGVRRENGTKKFFLYHARATENWALGRRLWRSLASPRYFTSPPSYWATMATRGVWQLTRLAFFKCNHGGSSRGARVFLDEYLAHFAKEHPQIEITTVVTPGRHPFVRGDYKNGTSRSVGLKNEEPGEILRQVMNLRSTIGRRTSTGSKANRSVKQRVVTTTPSIQQG